VIGAIRGNGHMAGALRAFGLSLSKGEAGSMAQSAGLIRGKALMASVPTVART
jgi:hypothetical protein